MLLGDLRSFLRSKRVKSTASDDEHTYINSVTLDSGLSSSDFLHIALDVAKGVEYLSNNSVSNENASTYQRNEDTCNVVQLTACVKMKRECQTNGKL